MNQSLRTFISNIYSGLPLLAQKRNNITYKFKTYKDGKVVKTECKKYTNNLDVENLLDAFPARGDQKWLLYKYQ